jgi:hypothetical protein
MADSNSSDEPMLQFDPVWLVLKRARPNFDPPSFFAPGELSIKGLCGMFGPSDATLSWPTAPRTNRRLTMDRIISVRRRRYGWGLVPRFVEVTYETSAGRNVAYFNDGAWKGWRPLLTGSNRRMVDAIRRHLEAP